MSNVNELMRQLEHLPATQTNKYQDPSTGSLLTISTHPMAMSAIWFKNQSLYLTVHWNKQKQQADVLDGELGVALRQSQLSPQVQLQRALEALKHGVIDFERQLAKQKQQGIEQLKQSSQLGSLKS